MKRSFLLQYLIVTALVAVLPSCVSYNAEPFTGKILPRPTGYINGVTNDWLYINLRTGKTYNEEAPNREVVEGNQKKGSVAMDWDIAFCGYRLRTNSGSSGIGKGGAADLGYGNYNRWTTKQQVMNKTFVPDNDSTIAVTMSERDWQRQLIKEGKDPSLYPWFDPNRGPATQITSANPVLCKAISFAGPPPVYTLSYHTYVVRTADGERYFKIQLVSWRAPNAQIGGEGGRICYYVNELK